MSFSDHPNAEREWEIIRDEASSDLEKAHAYNHLAQYHGNWKAEFETALCYAEQAEILFRKCNDIRNVGDSIYQAGEANFKLKNYVGALDSYSKAAEIFRSEVDQVYLATCIDRMADCYLKLNQKELAVQHYRDAARMFEFDEKWSRAALERLYAAETLVEAGEATEAEFEATLAIKHFDKAEETEYLPRAYNTRGRALQLQHQHEQAVKDFDAAISLAQYENAEIINVAARYHKTESLFALALFEECSSSANLTRKAIKKTDVGFAASHVDLIEAKVALAKKDHQLAEKLAQKCRTMLVHTDKALAAEVDYLLAEVELANGKQEVALERYEIALDSLAKVDRPKPASFNVCVDYALLLIQTPQLQRAIDVLDLVPHVEFLEPKFQLASHNIRARAHYLLNQYDRCLEVLEQVFAITGEDWSSQDYAYAIETKARALVDIGSADSLSTLQYAVNLLTSQGVYEARYLAQQLRELQLQTQV
jgi:tetratricopeptide (TPR) repeat protein